MKTFRIDFCKSYAVWEPVIKRVYKVFKDENASKNWAVSQLNDNLKAVFITESVPG